MMPHESRIECPFSTTITKLSFQFRWAKALFVISSSETGLWLNCLFKEWSDSFRLGWILKKINNIRFLMCVTCHSIPVVKKTLLSRSNELPGDCRESETEVLTAAWCIKENQSWQPFYNWNVIPNSNCLPGKGCIYGTAYLMKDDIKISCTGQ